MFLLKIFIFLWFKLFHQIQQSRCYDEKSPFFKIQFEARVNIIQHSKAYSPGPTPTGGE